MKSVLAYVRSLLGWDEPSLIRTNYKRDRTVDDFSSDDDTPALKRLKQLEKTSFPDIMTSNSVLKKRGEEASHNVRYVPIQVEATHPSTSTPNIYSGKFSNNAKRVPVNHLSENGPSTPRKPRVHTPVPVIHAVVEDDDEVVLVETKRDRKPSRIYIEDDDDENQPDDDVVFVKKVTAPPPAKPFKFFLTKNNRHTSDSSDDSVQYYKLCKKLNDRNTNLSPKHYTKFKSPPGITKSYRREPEPVPRWMQQAKKPNLIHTRNIFSALNGNGRTTLSEVFNLDEKKNYQDLIKRVAETTRLAPPRKPIEIINLAEDAASFRNTQRDQKRALNEIRFVEKGINAQKESEVTKEYDPITVASINSSDSEVEIVPSESSTTSSVKINRQNSLKDAFKDRPITAKDWLAKLDTKYKKKLQDNQVKARDVRRECDIISKVNFEQRVAHLEHKLKHELSIPESLIEEVPPTVELPELTPEQEKLINRILGPGPVGQVLVEKFNLRITRQDLKTLSGLNWLNDEVINFYMNLLMQRCEERKDLPKVYATNTFFYPKLMQSGQAGLRRWTRKVDIFSHKLIVVPVHLGVHWCLSIIDFRSKKISYLDSMGSRNQPCLDALLQYLRDEHQDKKGQPFDATGWKTENLKDIPQQMNGSDCGMFACTFAEFSSRDAPFTFSQQHMPYLRRKMALEIVQGKLLL